MTKCNESHLYIGGIVSPSFPNIERISLNVSRIVNNFDRRKGSVELWLRGSRPRITVIKIYKEKSENGYEICP